MSGLQRFDNLVLGSGEAGKYLAWTLAKGGQYSGGMQADRPLTMSREAPSGQKKKPAPRRGPRNRGPGEASAPAPATAPSEE